MTPLLQHAGWALIHFVWQGTVIALVAAAALRLTERRSANLRYVIGCVALAAMLAAPAMTARLLWTAPLSTASGATGAAGGPIDANDSPAPGSGKPAELLAAAGIDADHISEAARSLAEATVGAR